MLYILHNPPSQRPITAILCAAEGQNSANLEALPRNPAAYPQS